MLHGEIKVNDYGIGTWKAVRKQHPPGKVNDYKVEVYFRDMSGVEHTATGTLQHKFGDGALVLASEVLAWAGREIYPGTEKDQ